MIELRKGQAGDAADAEALSTLILGSASTLLPYLFGGSKAAHKFIEQAAKQTDGQYSAARHILATSNNQPIGCMTTWHANMPASFHEHTLSSLSSFLDPELISQLIRFNPLLAEVFVPPKEDQLCLGHLSVLPDFQGQGVGKKLVAHAILIAKKMLLDSVVLDVEQDNAQAISFYHGCGFVEQYEKAFSPTEQVFIRMELRF